MNLTKNLLKKMAGVALAGVLLVGIPVGVYAAQNNASPECNQDQRQKGMMHRGEQFGAMKADMAKFIGIDAKTLMTERQSGKSLVQIAGERGKSEADLFTYIYDLHKEHIAKLVADGKITQEQVDQRDAKMKERITFMINNTEVGKHHGHGMWGQEMGSSRDSVAQFIGIDTKTLMTERQSGKSLVQIASANGKTESDLYNYIYDLRKTHIEKAVADGKITQEQANLRLEKMKEHITTMINRTEVGHQHKGMRAAQ